MSVRSYLVGFDRLHPVEPADLKYLEVAENRNCASQNLASLSDHYQIISWVTIVVIYEILGEVEAGAAL